MTACSATTRSVGTVAALWRYPVKSMQGERVGRAPVGAAGLLGDRGYAVVEADTGRVASAKHPRRWGALFACRAAFVEPPRPDAPLPPAVVTLPDGTRVRSDAPEIHARLSALLGRLVRLAPAPWYRGDGGAGPEPVRETDRTPLGAGADDEPTIRDEPLALVAPAGTWLDVAPLHLLSTATLAALARREPAVDFDVRRFRPNVVVDAPGGDAGPAFAENAWLGATLTRGPASRADGEAGVVLTVVDPTPRCVVTTLGGGGLAPDPRVLRTIVQANTVASRTLAPGVPFAGVAGVYAAVASGGTLSVGDRLAHAAAG